MAGLYPAHRKWGPDYEGKTPYELHREVEYQTKEYLVAVEQVKLMQEELKKCFIKSGPNHFEDCKELREKLWTKMNLYNYGAPGPARSVRVPPPPSPLRPALRRVPCAPRVAPCAPILRALVDGRAASRVAGRRANTASPTRWVRATCGQRRTRTSSGAAFRGGARVRPARAAAGASGWPRTSRERADARNRPTRPAAAQRRDSRRRAVRDRVSRDANVCSW